MYDKAIEILNILENNNYKAYIVGGFVRDKLLGKISDDIDIITSASIQDISNIFSIELNGNYLSTKLDYKGYNYDITTFRKEDDYSDYRRPNKIESTSSLEEDLKRRDFTINAICIDKDSKYVDLLNGIEDLNNKIIRCIGDSDFKLKQDPLRILRALRFSSIYSLDMDDNLVQSINKNKELISKLSFDRIKKELDIVFNTSYVNSYIKMIDKFDLFKILKIKPKNSVKITNNYLTIWSQLDYSDEYNFSNKEDKYINSIKDIINSGIDNYILYKYDIDLIKEANKIIESDINIDEEYNNLKIKSRKDIAITVDEILNIVVDNSNLNKIYIDLEKQILYNKLTNTKKDIISYLEGDIFE